MVIFAMAILEPGKVPVGFPEDVRLFYAQSNAIVEHMMDKFGEHKMPELLSELKDEQPEIKEENLDKEETPLELNEEAPAEEDKKSE